MASLGSYIDVLQPSSSQRFACLGADLHAIDKHGQSVYNLASKKMQAACVEVIVRRAPDIAEQETKAQAGRGGVPH